MPGLQSWDHPASDFIFNSISKFIYFFKKGLLGSNSLVSSLMIQFVSNVWDSLKIPWQKYKIDPLTFTVFYFSPLTFSFVNSVL